MALRIPFALRTSDGRAVDATQVLNGRECGCVCPGCGRRVDAKQGTQIAWHFAHSTSAACVNGLESSLHLAAKQIIGDLGCLWLPGSVIAEPRQFRISRLQVERNRDEIRPDLIAHTANGRQLAVEIWVTHKVSPEKCSYLEQIGLSCVEYRLGDLSREIGYAELKRRFEANEIPVQWVYNARAAAFVKEAVKQQVLRERRLAQEQRALDIKQQREFQDWFSGPHAKPRSLEIQRSGDFEFVAGCPIGHRGQNQRGQRMALVRQDCSRCPYFTGRLREAASERIGCVGHFPMMAKERPHVMKKFGAEHEWTKKIPPPSRH